MGDWGGKFTGLGETRSQKARNHLDDAVGGDEGIVLAGQLLNELLVLVQLLQVLRGHGVDAEVLGTIDIMLVAENTDAHSRAGNGGQLDGAGETLVTLGIIVLQADLELDGLEEISLFFRSGRNRGVVGHFGALRRL